MGLSALDHLDAVLAHRPDLRLRVSCPSQEFSDEEMAHGTGRWLSGVRGLWESLSLAKLPALALVMLQAPAVPRAVLDYLFDLCSAGSAGSGGSAGGQGRVDCRERHALVELDDARERHLSEKLLAAPELLGRLRRTVRTARASGHVVEGLSCFASSDRMARLAEQLELDLLETAPRTLGWGSKAGSRRVFRRAGIPHPPGTYAPRRSVAALSEALAVLARRHGTGRWLVKVDRGFGSGHGNATVEVDSLEPHDIAQAITGTLRPMCVAVGRDQFLDQVRSVGAVVEKLLTGPPDGGARSPSSLAFLRRDGCGGAEIEVLGTHDQILAADQSFVGCTFPADTQYRAEIIRQTRTVLAQLAGLGVSGHVGVDFLARPSSTAAAGWSVDAIEINLRQTGTTHPNHTVRALVDGEWSADGRLIDHRGREVAYHSTDGLISLDYRGVPASALVAAMRGAPGLAYDASAVRGVVPHLWTALEPFGKVGATFIGQSTSDCADLRVEFVALLVRLAAGSREGDAAEG